MSALPGWVKPVAILVGAAALIGFGGREAWNLKARLDQADADALLVAQQAVTIGTLQQNAKDEQNARTNNAGVTRDLPKELADATLRADNLARRLRAYQATAAVHTGPVPADHPGPAAPAEVREPSGPDEVERAGADYDAACQRDALRHDKLIEELAPQLKKQAERAAARSP